MQTLLADTLRAIRRRRPCADARRPRADLSAWEQDWRKRSTARRWPWCAPANTAEVAAVVPGLRRRGRLEHRAPGRQHRPGGGLHARRQSGTQVLLSLQRLNAVRAIDAANLTMTVEPAASCKRCRRWPKKPASCSR
jgi:FAD/FMN-containing dehydrogenase